MPSSIKKSFNSNEIEESELRRGPWTLEEDTRLTHYIAQNGEGRWDMVAKCAGLKRTGKSCRLRWLNYLKPDIKRGNFTPQEQLLILELHSKWGNRWSKIAQYLPRRTDNEIKNYWRTRVQKQARQLNIESNSGNFFEAVRSFWMPRLLEKMEQNSSSSSSSLTDTKNNISAHDSVLAPSQLPNSTQPISDFVENSDFNHHHHHHDSSSSLSGFMTVPQPMDLSQQNHPATSSSYLHGSNQCMNEEGYGFNDMEGYMGNFDISSLECQVADGDWAYNDVTEYPMWNMDDIWQFWE